MLILRSLGHPIADAHPGNLDNIVFPGQDFNNARAFDFEGVNNWNHQNKRKQNPYFARDSLTYRTRSGPLEEWQNGMVRYHRLDGWPHCHQLTRALRGSLVSN